MSKNLLHDSSVLARRNLEHIRQVPEKLTNVTIEGNTLNLAMQ